jgi:hypothetical protein
MRLLQSVLPSLGQTKKPQQKFITHLLRLLLMFPGHATFRNLRRSSSYHERTCARWYARDCDFVSRNKAAILQGIPPDHAQAVVIDASVVPKSGKTTSGLDRFWNGSHSRSETGLAISALAWRDITANCAYALRVEQTPPTSEAPAPEATRIAVSLEPVTRVVSTHDLNPLRSVITDGYYSKQKCMSGVHALGRHQSGKLRIDANLRYRSQGPTRRAPGRPTTSDGQVNWDDLSRFAQVETGDDHIVLYHQVLNHVQFQCTLRVVLVVDTKHHRRAVLFRTDVDVDALAISRSDKARFHIAFLCRDAKQFTGLCDAQARSHAKLNFHFHASLRAVTLAKLAARQQHGHATAGFSMASLKRRAVNQHLIEHISQHLAKGHSLEKFRPDYEALCNYGTITEMAA